MYTQDFIKRMINQLVAALQMIAGLRVAGQYGQALQAIDQALETLLGLKADLVKRLDDQTILNSLTKNNDLDTDRLLILADLFKEEGDVLAALQRPAESYSSHLRALNFYIEVALSSGPQELDTPDDKLLDLFHQIEKHQLPHQTLYGLFAYFEKYGRFAQAAGILNRLADDPSLKVEVQQESQEYYRRLLAETDAELIQGDLPRAEIERRLATYR
jgi:hypothetical protein